MVTNLIMLVIVLFLAGALLIGARIQQDESFFSIKIVAMHFEVFGPLLLFWYMCQCCIKIKFRICWGVLPILE